LGSKSPLHPIQRGGKKNEKNWVGWFEWRGEEEKKCRSLSFYITEPATWQIDGYVKRPTLISPTGAHLGQSDASEIRGGSVLSLPYWYEQGFQRSSVPGRMDFSSVSAGCSDSGGKYACASTPSEGAVL